ncbi:hypothetical protein ACHQM5_026779 [Ranunculus cassubicifolius]
MLSSLMMSLFLLLILAFTVSPSLGLVTSTISAAPAILPEAPISAPLSPDITPLFPSPKGMSPAPNGESSSLPTIPSSLSPPNPDEIVSYGPDVAMPPSATMPMSTASSLNSAGLVVGLVVVLFGSAFL